MRTLKLTLENDDDVKRIAEWAVPEDAFEDYSKQSLSQRWRILDSITWGTLNNSVRERNLVATGKTIKKLEERAHTVAVILWACTTETEPYGLKLAQAYIDRLRSFYGILYKANLCHISWQVCEEFITPSLPSFMRETHPEAEYSDFPYDKYTAEDIVELQRDLDWYPHWYPRRDYCRKLEEILSQLA